MNDNLKHWGDDLDFMLGQMGDVSQDEAEAAREEYLDLLARMKRLASRWNTLLGD